MPVSGHAPSPRTETVGAGSRIIQCVLCCNFQQEEAWPHSSAYYSVVLLICSLKNHIWRGIAQVGLPHVWHWRTARSAMGFSLAVRNFSWISHLMRQSQVKVQSVFTVDSFYMVETRGEIKNLTSSEKKYNLSKYKLV
jgi:hypothetical protein